MMGSKSCPFKVGYVLCLKFRDYGIDNGCLRCKHFIDFQKDLVKAGRVCKEENMSKEITKEQKIQAIRESISHWKRDILKPLQEGRKISEFDRQFGENDERLAKGVSTCAFYQFAYHPTLENAQNMVLVLQQVLIDALEEKRQRIEKPAPTTIRPGLWYNSKDVSYLVLFKNQDVQDVWEYYCLHWQRDYVIRVKREDLERQIEEERWIYYGDAKKIRIGFEFDER